MNITCAHEGVINLNHTLTCRLCGMMLESLETQIGKTQSRKRASRMLEEIAVAGGYIASRFSDDFVVYVKPDGALTEEITAKKEGDKEYTIIKKITNQNTYTFIVP